MQYRSRFVVLIAVLVFTSPRLAADGKKGRPDPSGLALWTAKGMPLHQRQHIPGLNAALLLTDRQIDGLYMAWRETVDHPDLLEKGREVKLNPNTTEEQRREYQRHYEAAHGRLQSRVAALLTPAQRELMVRIEVLYREAEEVTSAAQYGEIAQAKASGNAQEVERVLKLGETRLAEAFRQRLSLILTAEQQSAMDSAAAEEKRREAEAAAAPKTK